jgi:hypothetical protein
MAARKHSVSKARIIRVIEAVTSAGHIVSTVKMEPDGSVRLMLDETGPSQSTASDLEKWIASHAHST